MTYSMTGFGQAQAEKKGERFVVTLKSVNHKYFETSFHLPVEFDYLESLFRGKIQQKIRRGRVTVSISHINDSSEMAMINEKLIETYYNALEGVRRKFKLSREVDVAKLISLPGVLSYKKEELKITERESLLKSALIEALAKLVEMRHREGAALVIDLEKRVQIITKNMDAIKKVVANVIEANKKSMPKDAFEGFLRSTDVAEEITRIDFHLKSFLKHLKLKDSKGKILDFIGQELQREINTLGAKVQDKHVAYQVVMIKDQIEKIREQVQNVE